jgi:hypothetical protein
MDHSFTGGQKYRELVLWLEVGLKADDLAHYKNYCCEVQRNES